MSLPADSAPSLADPSSAPVRWAALVLVVATIAAYSNSLAVPFLFDDVPTLVENPAIRKLWASTAEESGGLTTSGRPLLRLTFALNHWLHGYSIGGYHVTNIAIHISAGLLLLGLVRRTWRLPSVRVGRRADPLPLALVVAAGWTLHPLQTESVTYVVQRAESLAGMFYLGTLYAFVRSTAGGSARRWQALAVISCLLGMASKETVVTAPVVVLLFDRTFVTGSIRAAWQQRRLFYLCLAATWLMLAALAWLTPGRGETAGFGTTLSSWNYALTQCRAIVHYLRLGVWPHPLVFDYGLETVRGLGDVWPQALIVVGLLVFAAVALGRGTPAGFLAASFLLLLAPSSSVVPVVTQTMAEHRMYLPLAPVLAAAALLVESWLGRRAWIILGMVPLAWLLATVARNRDYRGEVPLWRDTVAKTPGNARAHNNLGEALFRAGGVDAALVSYQRALALQPTYPETHYGLAVALAQLGRLPEAIPHYERALRYRPDYPEAHNNLGNALVQVGRVAEAIRHYEQALLRRPTFSAAHNNLGNALLQSGRAAEAAPHFRRAIALRPEDAEAHYNLGNAHAATGAMAEALADYERALAAKPDYVGAQVNAGNALLALGRTTEALARYERAVTLEPRLTDAHYNLGATLLELERWAEAVSRFQTTLAIAPDYVRAERALGFALARTGREQEAILHYERYLQVAPDDAEARAEWQKLTTP